MPPGVEYLDGVAWGRSPDEISDFAAIDPGMAGSETPIHARLEDQPRHKAIVTFTLRSSQHDDHQERVVRVLHPEAGLETVEPVNQLQAASQVDQASELLREDHPRPMDLSVDVVRAVVLDLELHVLRED